MQYEKSCGAVVVDRSGEVPKFLCVLQKAGHWSLPKGRATEDDNEKVAAVARIKNETGLEVRLLGEFRIEARYAPKPETMKTVVFFFRRSGWRHRGLQSARDPSVRVAAVGPSQRPRGV